MLTNLDKLIEYYDDYFKVENSINGTYGAHYDGLAFDTYFNESIYQFDYINVEDYFISESGFDYSETESLFSQLLPLKLDEKIKVIETILTLVNLSTYREGDKKLFLQKSTSFLQRYGLEVDVTNGQYRIMQEYRIDEGSYCEVYFVNENVYKKKLKTSFSEQDDWIKRFKYEFENMEKLSSSPFVLKVFNYDSMDNSYLMERCDCNLYDFLNSNPFISDDERIKIIRNLILGMIDVHQAGIIHRDLHLGNILLKDREIVLSDFGLSKDTMVLHSLKSTSTPKNSHYFMDPIGLSDFTKLDKLSDIYSVGKIIEYITQNTRIHEKLEFIISKSTTRIRKNRYQNLKELLSDFDFSVSDYDIEELNKQIIMNLREGKLIPGTLDFIKIHAEQSTISTLIVEENLTQFGRVMLTMDLLMQKEILDSINETYIKATGYGGFQNYDIFAEVMYQFILESQDISLRKKAYVILKGCAQYRYEAKDKLDSVEYKFPTIKSFEVI